MLRPVGARCGYSEGCVGTEKVRLHDRVALDFSLNHSRLILITASSLIPALFVPKSYVLPPSVSTVSEQSTDAADVLLSSSFDGDGTEGKDGGGGLSYGCVSPCWLSLSRRACVTRRRKKDESGNLGALGAA